MEDANPYLNLGDDMTTFTTQDRQDAQRIPLTDEEILATFNPKYDTDIEDDELIKFARAIERAHGIGE